MSTSIAANNIPRVTEILRPFTSYDQVPKDILERAAARGTSVHALCAGIAKGNWIPDGVIAEELLGYVQSFRKWQAAQVKEFVIIEKRYTDINNEFTGQLDFVVRCTDDKWYLVDLKTSSTHQKTYPIQMAAYNCLLMQNNIYVSGAMLIYLDKTGEFPDIESLDDEEMEEMFYVFSAALHCYKYFKIRKKKDVSNREECVSENLIDHGGVDIHTKK
jgi:hypothetical protein